MVEYPKCGKSWIVVMEKGDERVTIEDGGIDRLIDRLCALTRRGFRIVDGYKQELKVG